MTSPDLSLWPWDLALSAKILWFPRRRLVLVAMVLSVSWGPGWVFWEPDVNPLEGSKPDAILKEVCPGGFWGRGGNPGRRVVRWFSVAAVTNYYRLSGVKRL